MSESRALDKMLAGMQKFGASSQKDLLKQLSKDGQKPEAIVVTCADSRVAPEILFGAEVGQLFVIRVAGNVVGTNELASIEYAALALEVPLCVVLGHSKCGAVSASADWYAKKTALPTKSLESLVKDIEPAVREVAEAQGKFEDHMIPSAIAANVRRGVQAISSSPQLAEKIGAGSLMVKGGVFDMDAASVEWVI